MNLRLAIVILNWNGKHFLEKFLPTLLSYCPDYAEVVIADNHSSDNSISFLQSEYPHLRLIINDDNEGFSKGYNLALQQINSEFYCLLNSDIEVSKGWIEPIMALFEINPEVAVIQPKLLNYNRPQYFEYAGAAGGFIDRYGYPFCRGRLFDAIEEDHGQYNDAMDIFWATGAAMFVRSNVYHEIGGLDEVFFAHMEEIDFCWRVKNRGYRVMIEPKSVVYHIGGGSLSKTNAFKTFLNFRNNLFLLLKNLPKNRLNLTLFMRFFMDMTAAFMFLLKGNGKDFVAVFKAHLAFNKMKKKMKAKRSQRMGNAYSDTYPHSIVVEHYLKGKKKFNGNKLLR